LASRGRYFRLTYSNVPPDEDPKLFKGRDGIAFCELAAVLPAMGYDFATTIYLYPDDERPLSAFPQFRPADLLVLPTRPPLHDKVGIIPPRRKIIHAAKTELEAALFKVLARYFEFCTRKRVKLSKYGANRIRVPDAQNWEHVEVYEYCGAEIQRYYVGPEPVMWDRNLSGTTRSSSPRSPFSCAPIACPAWTAASWPASAWTAMARSSGTVTSVTHIPSGWPSPVL